MIDLRPDLLVMLNKQAKLNKVNQVQLIKSKDGHTAKYLLALEDGQMIETVLMRYRGRTTVCVSTQVGCAMGCVFCATGHMGFMRHLSTGEIISQFTHVARDLASNHESIRNVVLMGMGEPLHNYDATLKAIEILMDQKGLAIGPRYITLSTVGLPKAIQRLADESIPINLAVSLHAASDSERNELVPVNRRWGLNKLVQSCRYYAKVSGRRVFFEFALIKGKNDSEEQAHKVGSLLNGIDAHVNLIPLNPTGSYSGQPSDDTAIINFQKVLSEYHIPSTVRQRRGLDIHAGCGQLRVEYKKNNTLAPD